MARWQQAMIAEENLQLKNMATGRNSWRRRTRECTSAVANYQREWSISEWTNEWLNEWMSESIASLLMSKYKFVGVLL